MPRQVRVWARLCQSLGSQVRGSSHLETGWQSRLTDWAGTSPCVSFIIHYILGVTSLVLTVHITVLLESMLVFDSWGTLNSSHFYRSLLLVTGLWFDGNNIESPSIDTFIDYNHLLSWFVLLNSTWMRLCQLNLFYVVHQGCCVSS